MWIHAAQKKPFAVLQIKLDRFLGLDQLPEKRDFSKLVLPINTHKAHYYKENAEWSFLIYLSFGAKKET